MSSATTLGALDASFGQIASTAGSEMFSVWRSTMRLLMRGDPVAVAEVASLSRLETTLVSRLLSALKDTEYDDRGRIVGLGLTLRPTAHRFEIEGRALYTWCALDTLIFPDVLGASARVTSTCFATGAPIQLEVGPEGPTGLAPESTVVSLVVPGNNASVRSTFCSQVHFFASREVAAAWLSERPTASVVTVAEAYGIGLELAKARFGASTRCC